MDSEPVEKSEMFRRSVDTQVCLDLLLKAKPGDVIEWSGFESKLGRKLEKIRGNIESARRAARTEEHRMEFACVRGVGLKRLADSEIPGATNQDEAHIRRTATKAQRKLKVVQYENLQESDKLDWCVKSTVFAMHQKVSSATTRKSIESKVEQSQAQLPIGTAFKALADKIGVTKNGETKE